MREFVLKNPRLGVPSSARESSVDSTTVELTSGSEERKPADSLSDVSLGDAEPSELSLDEAIASLDDVNLDLDIDGFVVESAAATESESTGTNATGVILNLAEAPALGTDTAVGAAEPHELASNPESIAATESDLEADAVGATLAGASPSASGDVDRLRARLAECEEQLRKRENSLAEIFEFLKEFKRAEEEAKLIQRGIALHDRLEAAIANDFAEFESSSTPAGEAPIAVDPQQFYGFFGELKEVGVSEILEFVRTTNKTGRLVVEAQCVQGTIDFVAGQAIFAKTTEAEGFDAFYDLMGAETGHVRFSAEAVDSSRRNLSKGTLQLMMKALRLLDERNSQMRR